MNVMEDKEEERWKKGGTSNSTGTTELHDADIREP
jgi:hypothetical protein